MSHGGEARVSAKSDVVWTVCQWAGKAFADIDAPTLKGVMVPLLLYADDLILMSESAAGLQKQLDALASFCEERQLTVNLIKQRW